MRLHFGIVGILRDQSRRLYNRCVAVAGMCRRIFLPDLRSSSLSPNGPTPSCIVQLEAVDACRASFDSHTAKDQPPAFVCSLVFQILQVWHCYFWSEPGLQMFILAVRFFFLVRLAINPLCQWKDVPWCHLCKLKKKMVLGSRPWKPDVISIGGSHLCRSLQIGQ